MKRLDPLIPEAVRQAQIEASNPSVSAWVAANAGSGKTYVLAQRVIRLMLNGTPPAKILCLTFTKAAAANMANQVFDTLASWMALTDLELEHTIGQMEGRAPSPTRRARARRLFAAALDTPGGLKVQTIHAFCTRLLQQFPFEANVAARFTVLEERAERTLIEQLRLKVLLQAAGEPDGPLGAALAAVLAACTDRSFAVVVDEMMAKRDLIAAWLAEAGGVAGATADLTSILGLRPNDTLDTVELEMVESAIVPVTEWAQTSGLLAGGLAADRAQSDRLSRAAKLAGEARRQLYLSVFLTASCEPRQQIVSKLMSARYPELNARLRLERDRLAALARTRCAIRARDRSAALLTLAAALIARYQLEKQARGLLDYADLVDKTLALMTKVEAAWVHYKLDLGIDHVLIDEAQDTSPKQWDIIKTLVAEFTTGAGARNISRSIFAVGDEKQSIFSFQDAAPQEFAGCRDHFERAHRHAALAFVRREFKHSFRSGANVLSAIDAVFGAAHIHGSITTDPAGMPPHIALPAARPGLVEIWPMIETKKRDEAEAWDAPFDATCQSSPQIKLAERIAATARAFIAEGRRPGDVLVLVRQRGPLFEAILRSLKNAGVAVAGADRLVLTEHIAVMDLLALADVLLLPADDLGLATVLKSPLFGFDDELLFSLAWARNRPLRDQLDAKAGADRRFAEAAAKLNRLAAMAKSETPFGFFARLLGREHARKQFLARLGAEAADPIDEFLNLALDYETLKTASLQGFVDYMRASATEVKRDMDIVRDELRVMTVHGAKGLEAPLVILADTVTRPTGPRDPRILPLPGPARGGATRLVWAAKQDHDVGPMAEARALARQAATDEYRRLLYVAMTRAAETLIVCGAQGLNGKPADCWYDLVFNALVPSCAQEPAADGQGQVWRWRPQALVAELPRPAPVGAGGQIVIPDWLSRDVPLRPVERHIAPSIGFGEQRPPRLETIAAGRDKAVERGLLVHRLVQTLPAVPQSRRPEAAKRYLARHAGPFSEAERAELASQVLRVLSHPGFSVLFAAGTHAEVPIVGRLPRAGRPALMVSGQVDRLAQTEAAVLLADYKTDRPAPKHLREVPLPYVAQLALYRAVLARIYPGREVRAALLFTEIPDLMEIPACELDLALASVLAA